MRTHPTASRKLCGFIALALSASLGFGVAVAGDAPEAHTIKTVLKLKNGDGASEVLRFDGALAVGESRGYETDAGTPVLVTRTDEGLKIEMAERTINIALPDADGQDHHGANVEKLVRIEGNGEAPNETRVVVLRGDHDGVSDEQIEQMLDGDGEALTELHSDDGKEVREVRIVRKQRQEPAGSN